MRSFLCYFTAFVCGTLAAPIAQHSYSGPSYQNQPQYISIPQQPQQQPPVYSRAQAQQAYSPPTQIVPQLLLPTNVDRQIQKAATKVAGPSYAQQIAVQQQQELANQAVAAAERRAQWQVRKQQAALRAAQEDLLYPLDYGKQPDTAAQTQTEYQVQYQPQTQYNVQQAPRPAPRPKQIYAQQRPQQQEEEVYDDADSSYKFGFDVTDDLNTNYQNRQEQRDGNKISGSYSVVDSDGFIRTVTYTADPKEGFKAEVVRKPTDIVVKIPKPTPPPKEQYVQGTKNVVYQYE